MCIRDSCIFCRIFRSLCNAEMQHFSISELAQDTAVHAVDLAIRFQEGRIVTAGDEGCLLYTSVDLLRRLQTAPATPPWDFVIVSLVYHIF